MNEHSALLGKIENVACRPHDGTEIVVSALRAVLDLHKPEPGWHPDFCGACLRQMPCPTVTAITTALEAS